MSGSGNSNTNPTLYELYKSGQTDTLRKRMGEFDKLEVQYKGNKERLLSIKHNRILAEHLLSSSSDSADEVKRTELVAAKLTELYTTAKATETDVTGLIEFNLAVAQARLGSNSGNYEALRILQKLFIRIEDLEYWLGCHVCLFLAQMYRKIGLPSSLGIATLKCLEKLAEKRKALPRDVLLAATDPREIPYEKLMRMIAIERSRLTSFSNSSSSSQKITSSSSSSQTITLSSSLSSNETSKPTLKDIRKEKDPLKMNAKLGAFYTDTNKPKLSLICTSKVLGMKGGDTPDMRYRAGIQLLCIGKPKKAFEMLCGASNSMSSNPEYWLKLSECCILKHLRRQRKLKLYNYIQQQNNTNNNFKLTNVRIEYPRRILCEQNSVLERAPTLAFGAKCCKNVLISLRYQSQILSSEQTQSTIKLLASGFTSASSSSSLQNIENSSKTLIINENEIKKRELIKQNALINLAWISLCSGDYISAANAAGQVLRTKPSQETKIFRFLACVYMAEIIAMNDEFSASSLISKDERGKKVDTLLDEAIMLVDDVIDAVNAVEGESLFEKVEHVEGVSDKDVLLNGLWTDYGVSKIVVDGDLKKSFECFKKANELYKLSQHTILLQSYLTLFINNFDEANNLLKKG